MKPNIATNLSPNSTLSLIPEKHEDTRACGDPLHLHRAPNYTQVKQLLCFRILHFVVFLLEYDYMRQFLRYPNTPLAANGVLGKATMVFSHQFKNTHN